MTTPETLLYRGSVKDLYSCAEPGLCLFRYSDRYSIFDWGEMPDLIPGKGDALASMARDFFALLGQPDHWRTWQLPEWLAKDFRNDVTTREAWRDLKARGVLHHAVLSDATDREDSSTTSRDMIVKKVEVPEVPAVHHGNTIHYDYYFYENKPENSLVPLEFICRFGCPEGSSLLKRIKNNPGLIHDLGLHEDPKEGTFFDRPVFELSTKLEPTDRLLTYDEAKKLAGLNQSEWDYVTTQTLLVAVRLYEIFERMGLKLWDGKVEWAFGRYNPASGHRDFILVDSIGPDELRLTYDNVQVSKEVLRQHYAGTAWLKATEEAKQLAKQRGQEDWQSICANELHQTPAKLDPHYKDLVSKMYQALAHDVKEITIEVQQGDRVREFSDYSDLKMIVQELVSYGSSQQ